MSKISYIFVLALSLSAFTNAFADEVSSSTTRVESPDYSSSTTTTTNDLVPSRTESVSKEVSTDGNSITTRKTYKSCPRSQRTIKKDTETVISH